MGKRSKKRKIEVETETTEQDSSSEEETARQEEVEDSEQDTTDEESVEMSVEEVSAEEVTVDVDGGAEVSAMQQELEVLRDESQSNYDKYLRSMAELENIRKRTQKERSDLLRYAGEHIVRDLLEVVDNLDLALKEKSQEEVGENKYFEGIKLIRDQFINVLSQHGVKSQDAVGTVFDPEVHEAMVSVPTADHEPGTVMEEYKKAYFFKDKLIRPAQVVVASELTEEAPKQEDKEEDSKGSEEE